MLQYDAQKWNAQGVGRKSSSSITTTTFLASCAVGQMLVFLDIFHSQMLTRLGTGIIATAS